MTTIAIFYSVLGLRPAEQDAAERFRSCGFKVALPDLYDGERTESLDKGFQLSLTPDGDLLLLHATGGGAKIYALSRDAP